MYGSLKKLVLCAAGLIVLPIAALAPSPAYASASGCAKGSAYGGNWSTCFEAKGASYQLDYVRVTAKPLVLGQPVSFPNFAGCGAHVQLYNNYAGLNHRNWDSPRYSCRDFASYGYSAVLSVYAGVPGGQYCTRVWIDNNGAGYSSASAACFTVRG